MAVSKVGLGWPVGERQYTTLAAWVTALKTSGSYEEAWCSGDLGASFVSIGATDFPQGALIRGDVQYTGANHTALAKLPRTLTIASTNGLVVAQDLWVLHGVTTQPTVTISSSNRVSRLYVEHTADPGSNAAILMTTSNAVAENCVVKGSLSTASKAIRPSSAGIVRNCISIGTKYGLFSEWTNSKTEKSYGVGASVSSCLWGNGRPPGNVTNASEDSSGDVGFQNLNPTTNFVDYANSDYRIRNTSPLHAAGIGAFFEAAADNTQHQISGASTLQQCSGVANTSVINSQQKNAGATVNQVFGAIAKAVLINGQHYASAGGAAQISMAVAGAKPLNNQNHQTTGNSQQIANSTAQATASNVQQQASAASSAQTFSALADTKPSNSQIKQSAGQAASVAGFIASTSWLNTVDLGEVQHHHTSVSARQTFLAVATAAPMNSQQRQTTGTLESIATASAQATASNSQHRKSTAELRTVANFIASTSWVNTVDIGNVQHRVTSGSTTQASSAAAETAAVNDQLRQSGGQVSAAMTAFATSSWLNTMLQKSAYIRRIKSRSITKKLYQTATRYSYQISSHSVHRLRITTQPGGGYMQELNFKQGASALLQIEHSIDNEPVTGITAAKYELYGRTGQVLISKSLGDGIEFSDGIIEIELTEADTAELNSSYNHQCVAKDVSNRTFYPLSGSITFGATKPRL